jgi:hypothetical protein
LEYDKNVGLIGKGGFCKVYKGVWHNKTIALKIFEGLDLSNENLGCIDELF